LVRTLRAGFNRLFLILIWLILAHPDSSRSCCE
jgi:hypothetical protein